MRIVVRTIELVLQTSSAGQFNALGLLAGKEDLQEQTEGIVAQCPQGNLGIIKCRDAFLWPAHLSFQLLKGQGRGVQEAWCGTTRNIVAGEG